MRKFNYIKWLNKVKFNLKMNDFMPYINKIETNFIKSLYYKGKKPYSLKLTVKYIEKEFEFK